MSFKVKLSENVLARIRKEYIADDNYTGGNYQYRQFYRDKYNIEIEYQKGKAPVYKFNSEADYIFFLLSQ